MLFRTIGCGRGRNRATVLSVVCVLLLGAPAWSYVTVLNNGPSSNRVDIVFLGDGYTVADHAAGTYADHVNGYLGYMFSNTLTTDPFYRYRNYFNVHRIDVVSNESGADKPPQHIYADTALDASYWWDGGPQRLLYVNAPKTDAIKSADLAGAGFTADMQYVTVNDTMYGGGGGDYAVYAGANSSAHRVAMHEMGHSYADLADEYDYGSDGPYTGPEPVRVNITTNATGQKWARWLGHNQSGIGVIGAYEGAGHYETGLYRPSENSKMRSSSQPFDAIGREKVILTIYDRVNPLDSWLDNTAWLVNPGDIHVQPIDDEIIEVEWYVDDSLVPLANSDTFNLLDYGYGEGTYTVSARAYDPAGFDPVNGWVRTKQWKLEQTVAWDVAVTMPELHEPGDANDDGVVDDLDLTALAAHWEQWGSWRDGDFNGDGRISDLDLTILAMAWPAGFGVPTGSGGNVSAVPEPALLSLLAPGVAALVCRKRNRRDSRQVVEK